MNGNKHARTLEEILQALKDLPKLRIKPGGIK
jgi:hypothetical protein